MARADLGECLKSAPAQTVFGILQTRDLTITAKVSRCRVQLETKVNTEACNHREGPYKGLLLVESAYYRFHMCLPMVSSCEIGSPM